MNSRQYITISMISLLCVFFLSLFVQIGGRVWSYLSRSDKIVDTLPKMPSSTVNIKATSKDPEPKPISSSDDEKPFGLFDEYISIEEILKKQALTNPSYIWLTFHHLEKSEKDLLFPLYNISNIFKKYSESLGVLDISGIDIDLGLKRQMVSDYPYDIYPNKDVNQEKYKSYIFVLENHKFNVSVYRGDWFAMACSDKPEAIKQLDLKNMKWDKSKYLNARISKRELNAFSNTSLTKLGKDPITREVIEAKTNNVPLFVQLAIESKLAIDTKVRND